MKTSEDSLQIDVIKALAYVLTDSQCLYFHVPNGGARSAREGAKFKKMGVRAGVPDICFYPANSKPFFIELKVGKNGLSASQKELFPIINELGYKVYVCRSIDEVIQAVKSEIKT